MRRIFSFVLVLALLTIVASRSDAQEKKAHDMHGAAAGEMKDHAMSAWKEMDAFHSALGAAFHPSEKGDLAPLKSTADTLAARARAWSVSTAPASCSSADAKATIAWLATSTAALAAEVRKGAADDALKGSIAAIHTKFETVEKACGGMHGMPGMKH